MAWGSLGLSSISRHAQITCCCWYIPLLHSISRKMLYMLMAENQNLDLVKVDWIYLYPTYRCDYTKIRLLTYVIYIYIHIHVFKYIYIHLQSVTYIYIYILYIYKIWLQHVITLSISLKLSGTGPFHPFPLLSSRRGRDTRRTRRILEPIDLPMCRGIWGWPDTFQWKWRFNHQQIGI